MVAQKARFCNRSQRVRIVVEPTFTLRRIYIVHILRTVRAERGEEVEAEKKALFFEDERVEIRFEKLPGTLTFKRSIAALTVGGAVKALAALVSHLAELIGAPAGDVLVRVAAVLMASDEPVTVDPAVEELRAVQQVAQEIAMGLRPPEYPGDCHASDRTGSQ